MEAEGSSQMLVNTSNIRRVNSNPPSVALLIITDAQKNNK